MKMATFVFHASVQEFFEVLADTKGDELSIETTGNVWSTTVGSDPDKKTALDQAFRQILTTRLKETGVMIAIYYLRGEATLEFPLT